MRAYGLRDLRSTLQLMQKALFIVQTWFRKVRLSVNADKTSMVFFYQQQEVSGLQEAYTIWNGIVVENQVKYLKVILDEKLNWNSHIDHRMQKAHHCHLVMSKDDRQNMGTET
jgi:hypothetical protein